MEPTKSETEPQATPGELSVFIDGERIDPPRAVGRPKNPPKLSFHDRMIEFLRKQESR